MASVDTFIAPGELTLFHNNPRKGDVEKIKGSLIAHGQYSPLTVNIGSHTGRANEVLTGNHTLMAFRELAEQHPFDDRWAKVKVHYIDVDDEKANEIVLIDNRSFDQGEGTDPATVLALLRELPEISGTGYSDDEMAALNRLLDRQPPAVNDDQDPESDSDSEEEPQIPSLGHRESAIGYTILFDNESQQDAWFEFLKWLREQYPDPELTVAERLVCHLQDTELESTS